MKNYLFYYTTSIYDSQNDEWETIEKCHPMNCENAHRAISLLNILYRNDMMSRINYYKELAEKGIFVKWAIFRVPMNDDGTLNYEEKKHCYSISSDMRLHAKKTITLNDILK